MATITLTVTVGAQSKTVTYNLTNAQAQDLFITTGALAWPPKDADGNIIVSPTNDQCITAWARQMLQYTKRDYKRIKSQPAPVTDIDATEG